MLKSRSDSKKGEAMKPKPTQAIVLNGISHQDRTAYSPPALSEPEQRMRVLELSVQLLIARVSISDYWQEGFQDAAKLLAAVPLATSEFESASRHLQHANAYCRQNEFGAAAYELRSLRGRLQRL